MYLESTYRSFQRPDINFEGYIHYKKSDMVAVKKNDANKKKN